MNAPFHSDLTTLDRLPVGARGRVLSVDWSSLDHGEACRLKHFGFYEGATVEPLHLGPLGRDPIAVRVGRMTVAIRRKHAAAVSVSPLAK